MGFDCRYLEMLAIESLMANSQRANVHAEDVAKLIGSSQTLRAGAAVCWAYCYKESMNRDLGQPIGYGRTAEIYAWQEDKVLKLFYDWFGLENIENEARITQAVHASGLPVPAVGEIVRVNERYGEIPGLAKTWGSEPTESVAG